MEPGVAPSRRDASGGVREAFPPRKKKSLAAVTNETKVLLDALESYSLQTSEEINDRLEQLGEKISELDADLQESYDVVSAKERKGEEV